VTLATADIIGFISGSADAYGGSLAAVLLCETVVQY